MKCIEHAGRIATCVCLAILSIVVFCVAGCPGAQSPSNQIADAGDAQSLAKEIEGVAIRVADDTCTEEEQQPSDPAWVALACQAEKIVVHILLPALHWQTRMHTRPISDAGQE